VLVGTAPSGSNIRELVERVLRHRMPTCDEAFVEFLTYVLPESTSKPFPYNRKDLNVPFEVNV
jgi:hypothetical protein